MYFSNVPVMLQDQDFQARHSDMLAAARSGRTVDPDAVVTRSLLTPSDSDAVAESLADARRRFAECAIWRDRHGIPDEHRKVGATLRIRLPSDYTATDSPRKPWYLDRIDAERERIRAAEKILADHQKLMAENIRLREQYQNMRPGLSRAEFQAAVAEACASPTPPPSSPL